MRTLRIAIMILVALNPGNLSQGVKRYGPQQKELLETPVAKLELHGASLFEALTALRQVNPQRIIFGFEDLDNGTRIDLNLRSATVGEVLSALRREVPSYRFEVANTGVIHVRPTGPKPCAQILDVKIAHFAATGRRTLSDVVSHLPAEVAELQRTIYPSAAGKIGASVSGGMEPELNFEVSNVTIRGLLDRISLYSIQLSKKAENRPRLGEASPPISWRYSFTVDTSASNRWGGYPSFSAF